MEAQDKRRIIEALILSSPEPLSAARLAEIVPYCDAAQAKDLVNELNGEYAEQDRSFEIWEVAGGFQIRTRAEFSGYLQKLQKERALRLSQAALETLAIIAYRQPVTRAEIEDVRGVDAGAVVKSLLERHLIRIAGQREVPGRPMLYGTTRRFLEVFGLEKLKDLPTLRELDELAREQGLLEKTSEDAEASNEADQAESEAPVEPEGTAEGAPQAIEEPLGEEPATGTEDRSEARLEAEEAEEAEETAEAEETSELAETPESAGIAEAPQPMQPKESTAPAAEPHPEVEGVSAGEAGIGEAHERGRENGVQDDGDGDGETGPRREGSEER
ncbi:MAG TPA: SMC-Scp complex subunit ScpB [Myxococcota bacterium]|nr:SMC-Scp complex subunit ScpB [Myxococcota bacterium]